MKIPTWDEMKPFEQEIVRRVCEKHKPCFGTGRIGYNKKGESIPCTCFHKGISLIMKGRELNERYPKDVTDSLLDGKPTGTDDSRELSGSTGAT